MTTPTPIDTVIREEAIVSPFDATRQTYLITQTDSAAGAAAPLLVLYLHGGTSHQDQGMTAGIYNNFFGRLWEWLRPRPVYYVCPEYRGGSWMGPAAEADTLEIIRTLRQRLRPGKVILTGGSMGGTGALIFATRHPEVLDAVLALCPATDTAEVFPLFRDYFIASYGGTPAEVPEVYRERSSRYHAAALAGLPVAIAHGSDDKLLPVTHSRALVAQLRALQSPHLYVEIDGCGHDPVSVADVPRLMGFLISEPPESLAPSRSRD